MSTKRKVGITILILLILIVSTGFYSSESALPPLVESSQSSPFFAGNFSLSALGQKAEFTMNIMTEENQNWTVSDMNWISLLITLSSQNLTFPFTGVSVLLNGFNLTVNGVPLKVSTGEPSVDNTHDRLYYPLILYLDRPISASKFIYINMSVEMHLVLYSLVYHISINEGFHRFYFIYEPFWEQ